MYAAHEQSSYTRTSSSTDTCRDLRQTSLRRPCDIIRDATHVWKTNRKTENIYFCHQWPSLPPKPLENRCRAFCCAVATPCHSCLGEKRKIEKYAFPSFMVLPCPPNPLKPPPNCQTPSKLSQVLLTKVAMARMQECFTVRRSLAQT